MWWHSILVRFHCSETGLKYRRRAYRWSFWWWLLLPKLGLLLGVKDFGRLATACEPRPNFRGDPTRLRGAKTCYWLGLNLLCGAFVCCGQSSLLWVALRDQGTRRGVRPLQCGDCLVKSTLQKKIRVVGICQGNLLDCSLRRLGDYSVL